MTANEVKLKDPKKAAAGRAGAAARKAKQEKLLQDLHEAKKAMQAPKEDEVKEPNIKHHTSVTMLKCISLVTDMDSGMYRVEGNFEEFKPSV